MENYLHLDARELLKELGEIPPESGLLVKFDDETIQRALRLKHVNEVLDRLQQSDMNAGLIDQLLHERGLDRERDERKLRY